MCKQVPNCDTLHALIREHRDAHKVPLNLEHRLMLAMAPDYDHLPLVNKVSHKLVSEFNSCFASIHRDVDLTDTHPAPL